MIVCLSVILVNNGLFLGYSVLKLYYNMNGGLMRLTGANELDGAVMEMVLSNP